MSNAAHLFLDTNIYLHYQLFDQIDWLKEVGASTVTIIMPPVTIRELNRHKDLHQRIRVRKHAGLILKRLYGLFAEQQEVELREQVYIRLEPRDPLIDFGHYQLNVQAQDDHLIGNIIMFMTEHPEDRVILVTSDLGVALMGKARSHEVEVIRLPDNLKLPDEPDPEEARIRELEVQLRQLQARMPDLLLTFENGKRFRKHQIDPPVEPTHEQIIGALQQIREQSPKWEATHTKVDDENDDLKKYGVILSGASEWENSSRCGQISRLRILLHTTTSWMCTIRTMRSTYGDLLITTILSDRALNWRLQLLIEALRPQKISMSSWISLVGLAFPPKSTFHESRDRLLLRPSQRIEWNSLLTSCIPRSFGPNQTGSDLTHYHYYEISHH